MDWKKATRFFTVATVVVIGIYDLAALSFGGNGATISQFALEMPTATVFALGFAFGHMFWPQTVKVNET